MPGHTIALCHTAKGYYVLAGDAGHHICYFTDCNSQRLNYFMHEDKPIAKETLKKMAELKRMVEEAGQKLTICPAHVGEYAEFEKIA